MNFKRYGGKGILLILALVFLLVNSSLVLAANDLNLNANWLHDNDLSITFTWRNQFDENLSTACKDNFSSFKLTRDPGAVIVYEGEGNTSTDNVPEPGNYTHTISAYIVDGNGSVSLCDYESEIHNITDWEDPKNITYLDATDYPNDNGDAIIINWGHSPDYFEDNDNYLLFYKIQAFADGDCSGTQVGDITFYRSDCTSPTYTWDGLTPGEEYCFDFSIEDASGNNISGGNVKLNATDNLDPAPPQNADAEDKEDDQGEEGIEVSWTSSADQGDGANDVTQYNLYARYGGTGDYTNFGNESVDTSIDQSEWEYSSEYDGGFFDSRIVADYLGLYVPPFDTTLFYFYISAYDGTFETQSTHVSESFNAEPWIEDMFMNPVPGTAQTGHDVSCLAFVCDVNNDDITASSEFSVTHFFGQYGSNVFETNASCVDLGILENGVIPQYPDIIIDCHNEHDEPVHVWECISTLDNSYTYKADKLSCSMTPNDGKEDGETESYVENVGIYSINNTAPYSSGVNIDPTNPLGSSTLECDFTINDVDGDGESVKGTPYAMQHDTYSTYKWYINNEGLNDFVLVPDKNESTLGDYFDQNDMVKCAVNVCDKEESWISNPLCEGEGVEGSSGQEYWILSGDVCAGYMSCGLMDETQCNYANTSNWDCEWDEDYIAATSAQIYGSKVGDFSLSCVNDNGEVCSNSTETLTLTVNGVACTINFSFTNGTLNISTAVANASNDASSTCYTSLNASNVTIDSYPEYTFDALKLYTNGIGSNKSIVVTGGTAAEALGFEVGQQDTGSDDAGWCTGTINTSCRDLDSTGCTNSNLSDFCFEISSVLDYVNSTISVIGGNSIPQIVDYEDDSTSSEPTDVGSDTEFNVTWLDEDGSETGMMMVCPQVGGIEDYSCDNDSYCSHNVTFGDNGNFAWVYTNETSMLIDTIEIKIRSADINGTSYTEEGNTTPFIFSLLAFEADNNTMNDTPTSSYSGYYDASTVILARSDWNSLTVDEWVTFTLQYNAQPLEGKYTALKLCVADPDSAGIQGDMGGTGYIIKGSTGNINTNQNWFGNLINNIGNFFRGIFGFTGRATTDYLDNCLTLGHPDYANSTIKIAAHNVSNATSGLIYDENSSGDGNLYDEANIKINYGASVSTQGSCPGSKTYCETEYSPDRDISCEYTAEDADDTTVDYHVRVCDDESACSIWRQGTFYVNHLPYIDWVTIGTNHLSYADGLTYTSDVNDDWNLQCIMGQAHDADLDDNVTSQVIIDADGWTTPFANVKNAKDGDLLDGVSLISCNGTNLSYIDVNSDSDYDYKIDTLIYNYSDANGTNRILLQYSNVTSGTLLEINNSSNCYIYDANSDSDYDNGEDIIWDYEINNSSNTFNENINYTYSWYVKRYGEDDFSKCSDFDWCDNSGNDILTHGYTEPSDEWICEISPVDWRGVGTAKNSSTIHVTSATGATSPNLGGPEIVSISDNSDSSTYLDMGDEVEIDVTWDGPFDSVKLYVCNSSIFIDNGGCWDYEFNRSTSSENPVEISFTIDESEGVFNITSGQIEYNIQLCNEDGDCNTGVGTFFVNHLPVVNSVSLLHYNGTNYTSGSTANSSNNLNCTTNVTDIDNNSIIQKTYKWYKKSGSAWQLYWQQSSTSANSSVLSYTATELGEQWKCQVVPNDQHSTGVAVDSSIVTITQDSSEDAISITSLSDDSNSTSPTNVGSDVTFEVAWSDPTSTSATLYICNSSDILNTGCGLGTKEFVSTGWTTSNPITATYTVEESDYGINYTTTDSYIKYYALICNNDYNCSSATTTNYNFGANHIPEAQNVAIPNSGVNDDLLCNHTFYDLDNNATNGLAYNSSNYAGEENAYYSWERYINGQWVDQQINVDTIPDGYTSEGDSWRCSIIVNDGYANGTQVYSSSVNIGDVNPSIDDVTINSDSFNRLNYGEFATFEIDWSDSTPSETVDIYICNSSSHNSLGCLDTTFCESGTLTTSPYSCEYNTSAFDETQNNITYYVYIYDSSDNTDSYDSSANDNNIYMTELGVNSSVVLWELPDLTDTTPINLIGYVNRDDISNTTVFVYAWRGYQSPNENTTNDLTSTSLEGTSTLEDDFDENSNYVVISSTNYSYFNSSNWISFASHNRTYFEKYNITNRTDLEDGTYMINISPNLTQDVISGESVYAYNDSYPNGWFNVSLNLFERQNTIKSKIKKQTGSGNVTGSWSSTEYVYYDNENPYVNISRIGNYSRVLTPTLNFELTDNYAVNNDTFVFTVLNTSGGQNYGDLTSNVSCTGNTSSWDCVGTPTLSNGTYNLTFNVNDTSNNSYTITREGYVVNTTETQPTVSRSSAEYNTTNLTFEVFVPKHNITGGTLQYAIGINYHPYTGWNNITSWVNLTNFTAGADYIISSTITGSNSTVNISTGNLDLISGGIYVANVRYQLGDWEEVWGEVGYSSAMQYVPGTSSGSGPSSVTVTTPPFSTSPIITISWTESTDDDYDISHYVVAVGNATYENTDWNTTSSGWLNVGNVLTSDIDLTLNSLVDQEEYYFTVAAVNEIGVKGTPISSLGTSYFDYTPPIVTVSSVAGDSDGSDGFLDSSNDGDTNVNVSGDEDMICYYSLYDQDFIDFNNVTKEDEYCNYGSADDEVTCNIEDLTQADYIYYIICKDSLDNQQNRSQNTQVNFTVDWVDAPEVNVTVTITDGTNASNSGSDSYALTDDSLTCNYTATDPDGDDEFLTASEFSWIIDGEEVGNGSIIDLSNHGDAGESIACQITVTDLANLSTIANETVYINNSVPTMPSALTPADNSYQTDSLLFNWTSSTDADGDIVSYVVNVYNSTNSLVMNQTITNDYYQRDISDTSDWPEDAYDWNVRSCDDSDYDNGCTDSTSNYTFTIDNTVPFVNITSPAEDEIIGQVLELYANVTDGSSGIDSVTYELLDSNSESVANGIMVVSGSQYYAQLVTLPFETGNYTINVTALDEVGNSASNTTNITIDLSAPKIQVDPEKWQFREQWIKDNVDINISINSSGTVFGSETNYSEISFTISYYDGTVMDTGDTSSNSSVHSWNFSYDISNWGDGRYDAVFVATDNFSNSKTITTWFMVDKTNPSYVNVGYSPADPEENDSVTLSIDWQNNVYVWDANEFNLDQYNTIIQHTDNTSNTSTYVNSTVNNGNLSINGNTFSAVINSSYFSPAKVVYWRSTCYDLAGNSDTTDWQNFTITSTPPVFNATISDIEWLEDNTYTNLTLSEHFYDPDDSISYNYTMYPAGTLFYESFTNLTDAVNLNNASHENVSVSNQSNRMSLLIQADSDNLLSNADFGDSTTDDESVTIPNSWVRHSYPVYSHNAPPNLSYVTVNEHDYYAQVVEVSGGLNYTLSMYANTSDSGYGRMHINWFNSLYPSDDTINKSLSYLSSTLDCDNRENCSGIISVATSGAILDNRERLSLISPENAAYAQIVLDSDSNSTDINIANVQFEQKDYASAFMDGDVSAGIFTIPVQSSGVRDNINASQGTISMFVKPIWNSSDQINDAVFFNIRETDGEDAFWLGRKGDNLLFAVDNFYYNVSLDIGNWSTGEDKFITARWNSTNLILDFEDTSTSVSIGTFTVDNIEDLTIYIGSDADGENQANAYIDEIAIYDYVRTDAEIDITNTQTNVVYLNGNYTSDGEINTTINQTSSGVTFIPYANYTGHQRIRFDVNDSVNKLAGNMVDLYVLPVNDAPNTSTISNQSWWVNEENTLNLGSYFADVDGDELSYTSDGENNITITIISGVATFSQAVNWSGNETVNFTAEDPSNLSAISNNVLLEVYWNKLYNTYVDGNEYDNSKVYQNSSLTRIYLSEINDSNITGVNVNVTSIISSTVLNSNVTNSTLLNCSLVNSTVLDADLENVNLTNGYIDPSNVTNSNITGNSNIINSTVSGSVFEDSNSTNSTVIDSQLYDSFVDHSQIYYLILRNANVTSNIICNGTMSHTNSTLIYNATESGCSNMSNLTNYPPVILSFTVTPTDDTNAITFTIDDLNYGSNGLNDNVSYVINWGDSSNTNGVTNNNSQITSSHAYSSSGTYQVTLTVTDEWELTDSASGSGTVTVSGGDDGSSSSSGGGSGGGAVTSTSDEEEGEEGEEEEPSVSASCYDNIKNQGEQGVDCGGPCSACVVQPSCYDNIKNQGEQGVDCGGPCSACKSIEEPKTAFNYLPYIIALIIALVGVIGFLLYKTKFMPPKRPKLETPKIKPKLKPLKEKEEVKEPEPKPVEKEVVVPGGVTTQDPFKSLRDYITLKIGRGDTQEHIKHALMISGWPEEVVDVALDGSKELESKLDEVESYVKNAFASGYKLENIKQSLIEQDWSEGISDLLLFNVYKSNGNKKGLKEYVDYKVMEGRNLAEIKQILMSVGWEKEVIESII